MKHDSKIIFILLAMFLLTQLVGLVIIDAYSTNKIPYGMDPPKVDPQFSWIDIVVSFAVTILIFILLMKVKANSLIRVWFTLVVFLTLSVSLTAILLKIFPESGIRLDYLALALAIPLTFYKIFKRNIIVHNATELLVYPGAAAVFVPILGVGTTIIILLIISVYDMYAVWKSKFMVNLAKYQINKVKIFTGFFIPYLPKKEEIMLKRINKITSVRARTAKLKKIKVALAILGGGDVVFPLIFAGVVYRASGIIPALMITLFATIALALLFVYSKKGKFYPAMPFLTAGCLIGWLIGLLF